MHHWNLYAHLEIVVVFESLTCWMWGILNQHHEVPVLAVIVLNPPSRQMKGAKILVAFLVMLVAMYLTDLQSHAAPAQDQDLRQEVHLALHSALHLVDAVAAAAIWTGNLVILLVLDLLVFPPFDCRRICSGPARAKFEHRHSKTAPPPLTPSRAWVYEEGAPRDNGGRCARHCNCAAHSPRPR